MAYTYKHSDGRAIFGSKNLFAHCGLKLRTWSGVRIIEDGSPFWQRCNTWFVLAQFPYQDGRKLQGRKTSRNQHVMVVSPSHSVALCSQCSNQYHRGGSGNGGTVAYEPHKDVAYTQHTALCIAHKRCILESSVDTTTHDPYPRQHRRKLCCPTTFTTVLITAQRQSQ